MSAFVAYLPQRQDKWRFVLALVLMAAAMAAMPGAHAVRRHGADALAVRQCMDSRGPTLTFQDHNYPGKFYLLCQLDPDEDKWGLQIVAKDVKGYREITSFIPKDGTLAKVLNYVLRSGKPYVGALP